MPSAIIKLKIILKILKFNFLPPYQGSEKSQKPIISQKMKIIIWGCLIAQMKRFDALITTQKTPVLCNVPFWKNTRKIAQNDHFSKITIFLRFFLIFKKWDLAESRGFLRCNQFIKTLHLSYQTPPYDDFHFLTYNWFLEIFRPPVGEVKNQFKKKKKF